MPGDPDASGTGVLIAGGNFNSTDHNWIYDNWRFGTMQFWVPAALRDEYDPAKQFDTSNGNHTFANRMGLPPGGGKSPNGLDHWWDDEGGGNCWEDNASSWGTATDNFTVDPGPCAEGGSLFTPGAPVKDAGFLSCSEYDRDDPTFRHPPGCNWFDSPSKPGADGPDALGADLGAASGSGSGPIGLTLFGAAVTLLLGLGLGGLGLWLARLGPVSARTAKG